MSYRSGKEEKRHDVIFFFWKHLNAEVDRQEQELARGLKEAQSRWSLEMSVLKESLDERQQGHSRGDYLLEDSLKGSKRLKMMQFWRAIGAPANLVVMERSWRLDRYDIYIYIM